MPSSLDEITSLVCKKIGKVDTAARNRAKEAIRRRYRMIWDSQNWRESETVATIAITASQQQVIVPHLLERVKAARWDQDQVVYPTEIGALFEEDPAVFERTGTPIRFSELSSVATLVAPGGKAITVVSDDATDTGIEISVRGEVDDIEDQEKIAVNGTTVATGTKLWDTLLSIGKPETYGNLTIKNTDGTTLVTLWPLERGRQHVRLWLHETPQDAKSLLLLGKRRLRDLWNDEDVPILRNIENALVSFVEADMLEYARQYSKAQVKLQEAAAHLAVMRDLDSNQAGRIMRIIPAYSGEWTREDFTINRDIFS